MVDKSKRFGRSGLVAARIEASVKTATLGLVLALLFAGCADPASPTTAVEPVDTMIIRGTVVTPEISPITAANVTLKGYNVTAVTDATGAFVFNAMPLDSYVVVAEAAGFVAAERSVPPGHNESILLTLSPDQPAATMSTERYKGHLQCAAEYLIIAGSCDRASTQFGGPALVDSKGIFEHHLPADWTTVVVDVVFETAAVPTFDGLRVTVKGVDASDALNEYEQYGRFHGSSEFTFRIEPGQAYPNGIVPVPANATSILFDVFAQGHAHHTVCDPTGTSPCFLGVGAGTDVQFELVVSTFTGERAPDGFTLN